MSDLPHGLWTAQTEMKVVLVVFGGILLAFCVGNMEDGLATNAVKVNGVWTGVKSPAEDTPLCDQDTTACLYYDAVVVLGGGPRGRDGLPPKWVRRRLDAALALDRCCTQGTQQSSALRFITTSFGTAHVPNAMDRQGYPVSEAETSASYLMSKGVDRERIVQETTSWDTIGNAVFTRLHHTGVRGWTRLLVITSDFHLPRSKAIFTWIFGLPPYAPLEFQSGRGGYIMGFLGVDDEGVPGVAERLAKEAKSLQGIQNMSRDGEMASMGAVHSWMFLKHDAYAAGGKVERLKGKRDKATYGG